MSKTKKPALFTATEVVDLENGRKDVRCDWFVIQRKRPLFGTNGLLQPNFRGIVEDPDSSECRQAATELFTRAEAKAFIKSARSLELDVKIVPATLPIPHGRKSFFTLLDESGAAISSCCMTTPAMSWISPSPATSRRSPKRYLLRWKRGGSCTGPTTGAGA